MGKRYRTALLGGGALWLSAAPCCWGQVILDGSLGPRGAIPGPDYAIDASLGQQRGGNLFHSFQQFDIGRGESARFSGPAAVTNVIGRVTGGLPSTIDGALTVAIPGAALYLINPAGLTLGPNATLDLPASLYLASADSLRFGDGQRFPAQAIPPTILSTAPVEAFGFVDHPGGTLRFDASRLTLAKGATLGLIGAEITLAEAQLAAPSGALVVVAASIGEVTLEGRSADAAGGVVRLGPGASLSVAGQDDAPAGSISVSAEALLIDGGESARFTGLMADASAGDGGRIHLDVNDLLVAGGAQVSASTFGAGDSGVIDVAARRMVIDGGPSGGLVTGLFAQTNPGSGGDGGVIAVRAEELVLLNDGLISAATFADGDGGQVAITAVDITLLNRGDIRASTFGGGDGGEVAIDTERLTLLAGSQITSSTFAQGDGGVVVVRADDLLINRLGVARITGISSQANPESLGDAGAVTVSAGRLAIVGGGEISSSAFNQGDGGRVSVFAEALTIDGQHSGLITGIFSQANPASQGAAGEVMVAADRIELLAAGRISSSSFSESDAGNVIIQARRLRLADGIIRSFSNATRADARGGQLVIDAEQIRLTGASVIETDVQTQGEANAGDIRFNAQTLLVQDQSRIETRADQGLGGEITVNAEIFLRSPGAVFDFSSQRAGNAGRLEVNAPELDLSALLLTLSSQPLTGAALSIGGCLPTTNRFQVSSPKSLTPIPNALLLGEPDLTRRVKTTDVGLPPPPVSLLSENCVIIE